MKDLLTENDRLGEYPPSYYAATRGDEPDAPPLAGSLRADVCIIGGGFTGLSAALHLAGQGLDVVVLEASRVGFGASGRNGGQMGSQLRMSQPDLEAKYGADLARQLWELAQEAKATIRRLVETHAIGCDLKKGQLHANIRPKRGGAEAEQKQLDDERRFADFLTDRYGYGDHEVLDAAAMSERLGSTAYSSGWMDWGAGHLHPLNLALGLARAAVAGGVRICERTRVERVIPGHPHTIRTQNGSVTAERALYAMNGYHMGVEGEAASHVMPINNFIVATEPLGEEMARALIRDDVCVADSKFVVNYYRLSADKRMLFGGGETYSFTFPEDIPALVRPNMEEIYPQLKGVKIDYAWGGTLGITSNRLPFMRVLDDTRLTASGYSGQGVAMATMAGRMMAEYVLGAEEGFTAFTKLRHTAFPGGQALRHPILVAAMTWYAMRDRLGI